MLYVSSSADGSNGLTAEKFNKWYNGKHISELLQVPGLDTAIRYVSVANLLLLKTSFAGQHACCSFPLVRRVGKCLETATPSSMRLGSCASIQVSFE